MGQDNVMNVSVKCTDDDRQRLAVAVGDYHGVDIAAVVARAGARETLDLATGRAVPATIAEQRSYRIYRLIDAGLPLDRASSLIAGIFHVSEARAERHLGIALARYKVELAGPINDALAKVFEQGSSAIVASQGGGWQVKVPDALVEHVREFVHDHEVADITTLHRGTQWSIPQESIEELCRALGVEPPAAANTP